MSEPFIFRKVLYLVEAVGARANSLDELLRGVNLVELRSIAYHMHHEFLEHRFVHSEYPNDFAYWTARELGDPVLAEKLAVLRVFRHRSLATLRAELGRTIAEHLSTFPEAAAERSPRGMEFYFRSARSVVMDCHRPANDLAQFADALAQLPSSSLYFHLFETRFGNEGEDGRDNDFASWIAGSLGEETLATQLANVDPYMFSLEEVRGRLLSLVNARLASEPPPVEPVSHTSGRAGERRPQ